ncbi:MAG: type IV pilus biogenesis/stability protein PilW [Pseudomonadota bacterium]
MEWVKRRIQCYLILTVILMLTGGCYMQQNPTTTKISAKQKQTAANDNVRLGLAYLQQSRFAIAKQKLLLALQQTPRSTQALDAMAYFQQRTGNNQLAEKYYKRALYYAPTSGKALNNYGVFLCRNKRYPQAIRYFVEAAKQPKYLHPDHAYENAGLCALDIPNTQVATYYFNQALRKNPQRITSLFELADIYYANGNYPKAHKYFQRFQQQQPKMTSEALWLGITREPAGRPYHCQTHTMWAGTHLAFAVGCLPGSAGSQAAATWSGRALAPTPPGNCAAAAARHGLAPEKGEPCPCPPGSRNALPGA